MCVYMYVYVCVCVCVCVCVYTTRIVTATIIYKCGTNK